MQEYKERKAHIEQRELQLVNEDESRRLNLIKVEQGLQEKEHQLNTIEQKNLVENRAKNVSTETDQLITPEGATSVEARGNVGRNTVISESTQTPSHNIHLTLSQRLQYTLKKNFAQKVNLHLKNGPMKSDA